MSDILWRLVPGGLLVLAIFVAILAERVLNAPAPVVVASLPPVAVAPPPAEPAGNPTPGPVYESEPEALPGPSGTFQPDDPQHQVHGEPMDAVGPDTAWGSPRLEPLAPLIDTPAPPPPETTPIPVRRKARQRRAPTAAPIAPAAAPAHNWHPTSNWLPPAAVPAPVPWRWPTALVRLRPDRRDWRQAAFAGG